MANTYKVNTKSSCVTDAHTSTNANVLTAGGSATLVILSILIANKTAASAQADVFINKNSGDDVFLVKNAPIPGKIALVAILLGSFTFTKSKAD